ncbi:MAG: peptide chain release factor N(5)-glutamine methyltransferase [Gammaproteobacteria bacterium]|nr:peptide chain release factor N(5)-glutamine methyltransferase [Gammaproteobacteria bacterium]
MSEVIASKTLTAALDDIAHALTPISPTPRLDAEVLLQFVSGATRSVLIAHPNRPLAPKERAALAALVERRRRGEPIAYLVGQREFWSLALTVTPATLIPRPETELLVERALAHLSETIVETIVDLGTGSGAIALAIAHERPQLDVIATDRSAAALAVAQANAQRLDIANVEFVIGDWLAPLAGQRFRLIVSNPPYIPANDPHLSQGDVRFEPREALVAGNDGLTDIRRIAQQARAQLVAGGWLLLEHGFDQAVAVQTLLAEFGYVDITSQRDFAGHERITEARAP